jgi:hypothetical protein
MVRDPESARWLSYSVGIVVAVLASVTFVVALVHLDVFRESSPTKAPSATQAAEKRDLPPFRSVELGGSNNVTITVGRR